MEDTRQFLIIADGTHKLRITAVTMFQAIDIAKNRYPQYGRFQCHNLVGFNNLKVKTIVDKF